VYGDAILDVVQQNPPAYVVYLSVFLAILFGGLTIYYNAGKLLIDSFKDIATENKAKSISLEKTTKDLQKKTILAKKMNMNTVTEVKTVQGQVTAIKDQLGQVETRLNSLETRFDGLETRFDGLETRFDGLETRFDQFQVHVDEQFHVVNSQLETITALLQNRTN
jgi:chromosome segregation ATPase